MHSSLRSLQVFAVFLLTVLSIPALASAAPHWVQATPFGGSMVALAEAPSSPQTLYSATVTGRFFRSLDGGLMWGERKSGLPGDLIADLVVDPQDPRTVFARSTGEAPLLRSRNGGSTWKAINPGTNVYVYGVTLDDEHPGVVYAATQGGLYRSSNAGDTWTVSAFAFSPVFAFAIDPHDANTFLAAIYTSGSGTTFWRSADHGTTWTESADGGPPGLAPGVLRILFDPARAGTAYAFLGPQGGGGTTMRTTDGGGTWLLLTATVGIHDLTVAPDGTLLAAAYFGMARSDDLGETWTPPLSPLLGPDTEPRDALSRLIVSPASPETLYAAGGDGVWKSTDGGGSWVAANRGIDALPVLSLGVAPAGPPNVVALAGNDVFRSADRGATWRNVHTSLDGSQPYVIDAFDPHNPQTIYGVTFDGQADYLVKSTNGGSDWSQPETGFGCGSDSICDVVIPAVAVDPKTPGTVIIGLSSFVHFQGVSNHLVRSLDGGATWKALSPLHNIQALVIDPVQDKTFYGLTCRGVYKSETAGTVWHGVGSGLPGPNLLCTTTSSSHQRLALDPGQPQTLYVGTAGQGVFRSTDGGVTFRPFNRGLETADVTAVLVDSAGSIDAAVAKKGVWRWDASLRRWTPLNDGLPVWDFSGALAFDPRHPSTLYAGTQGHGVYRLDL